MVERQGAPRKLRQEAEQLTGVKLRTCRALDRKPEYPDFEEAMAGLEGIGHGGGEERGHARLCHPTKPQVHGVEPLLGSEGSPLTGTEANLATLANPGPTTLRNRSGERVAAHTFENFLRGSGHGVPGQAPAGRTTQSATEPDAATITMA
jgi:hypothetical protein